MWPLIYQLQQPLVFVTEGNVNSLFCGRSRNMVGSFCYGLEKELVYVSLKCSGDEPLFVSWSLSGKTLVQLQISPLYTKGWIKKKTISEYLSLYLVHLPLFCIHPLIQKLFNGFYFLLSTGCYKRTINSLYWKSAVTC